MLHQTRGGHGGGGTKLGIDAGKFGACLAVGIEFGGFERRRVLREATPHVMFRSVVPKLAVDARLAPRRLNDQAYN